MAAPALSPAAVDATQSPDPQTWDHVVRAVAHCGQLEAAAALMRLEREHAHDPELLWITRAVRGLDGDTLLACAARHLDVARVAEILAGCPTPACRAELVACGNSHGTTALHFACFPREEQHEEAALELVEVLLGAGADPRAGARWPDSIGEFQPIHHAAQWSARLVQRLVAAGASIDGNVAGYSTLLAAARACTALGVRMIPALVALGARSTGGNIAMSDFAMKPAAGAPPTDGEVAAALRALLRVGCSLTEPDFYGDRPMDLASRRGNAPMVRALLSLGVAATTKSLACAVEYPDTVRLLLAAGAPAGGLARLSPEHDTVTPLMQAAFSASLESVQLLLAAGASVSCVNSCSMSALMCALQSESVDAVLSVVDALLAAGSLVNSRDLDGATALHHLACHSHFQPWAAAVARLLRDSGADGRIKNNAGATPAQCVPVDARGGELYGLLLAED